MVFASASLVAAVAAEFPAVPSVQLIDVVPRTMAEVCFQVKSETLPSLVTIENTQDKSTVTYNLNGSSPVLCASRDIMQDTYYVVSVNTNGEQQQFKRFFAGSDSIQSQYGFVQFYVPHPGVACVHTNNPNELGKTRVVIRSQVGTEVTEVLDNSVYSPQGLSTHCENYPVINDQQQVVRLSAAIGKAWAHREVLTDNRVFAVPSAEATERA